MYIFDENTKQINLIFRSEIFDTIENKIPSSEYLNIRKIYNWNWEKNL